MSENPIIKLGLIDAVREAREVFLTAIAPIRDAIYGIEYRRSALVPRGEARRVEVGTAKNERTVVYEHPLDAIAREHAAEPTVWLDESLGWITERAHRELDSLLVDATNRAKLGEMKQRDRMSAWMHHNGVAQVDLDIALVRAQFQREGIARKVWISPASITNVVKAVWG